MPTWHRNDRNDKGHNFHCYVSYLDSYWRSLDSKRGPNPGMSFPLLI